MTTLLKIFDEKRWQLSERINNHPAPEEAISEVKNFLTSLLAEYRKEKDESSL